MLTVLIATRNGSLTLPRVLQAYTSLLEPASGWKLVVIDNRSQDDTRYIVNSFRDRLPLTYVYEGTLGKNAALNTGLIELEGDLAVFADDDTFPRPDWLVQLRTTADEHPSYSMFGGTILPLWQAPPPPWLSYVPAGAFFALTDPAMKEGPTEAGTLFGPNMAVRAEVFHRGARFDESIGPCGRDYAMGGETEFVQRLARQGHKAWHVQRAVVQHYIRDYQMQQSWVLERAIRFGRGQFRLSQWEQPCEFPEWPAVAVRLAPRICRRIVRMLAASLAAREEDLFTARRELNFNRGILLEAYRQHRQLSISGGRPLATTRAQQSLAAQGRLAMRASFAKLTSAEP